VLTFRQAILLVNVLLQASLMAQVVAQVPADVRGLQQVAEPSIPSDPLELVTGDAQPVQGVSQRAEIVNLLSNAHRHSNVRAQPYDLKTTFTASGSSSSDGMWQLEDTSPGAGLYRWTAQGPNYSSVNLNANRIFYSSQPANSLPLRLVQAREAIFYTEPLVGPHASLRTASGSLNGVNLVCALIAHNATASAGIGGRRWEEEEYCVDPKAGTLITYSLAPGLYVLHDYSKPLLFHDKVIANKFTITQAGRTVVEAQTESVTDPPNNPAAFQTAGLNQIGVGPIMSAPWRFRSMAPSPAGAPGGTAQMVVLHGMQSPDGRLTDAELLASSDASLNEPALAIASKWVGGMMGQESEPGVTPQSHEVLMTVQYFTPRQ
jgi:hypothetical protein